MIFPLSFCKSKLLSAIKDNNTILINDLLDNDDVNPNIMVCDYYTPLIAVAQNNNISIVKKLLKHPNIDPNKYGFRVWFDEDGADYNTPLCIASDCGYNKIVEELLKHDKINPNTKDFYKNTPLMLALYNGYDKIVEQLLNHPKIDVYAANEYGYNALSIVKNKKIKKIIIDKIINDFSSYIPNDIMVPSDLLSIIADYLCHIIT